MKLINVLLAMLIFSFQASIVTGQELSSKNKIYVKQYSGQYIKLKQGEYILRGILSVESSNGKYKLGKLDPSFGIAQMQVQTARGVAKLHNIKLPSSFSEIRELLIHDDNTSIKLAALHLGDLWEIFGETNLVIIAYNKGEPFVFKTLKKGEQLPVEYLNKVRKAIEQEFKKDASITTKIARVNKKF